MARKTYPLTDETFKIVSGFENEIAKEMEVDPSYVRKIKTGDEPDRYPAYRHFFRAACNAQKPDGTRPPVELHLNELTAIYIRSRANQLCTSEISAKMIEKITSDAKATAALVESLADGKLDKAECHLVLSTMARTREINDRIEKLMHLRLGELDIEEKAK